MDMRPYTVISKDRDGDTLIRVPTEWMTAFINEKGKIYFRDFVDSMYYKDLGNDLLDDGWRWLTKWFNDRNETMWDPADIDRGVGTGIGDVYYQIWSKFGGGSDWLILWDRKSGAINDIKMDEDDSIVMDVEFLNMEFGVEPDASLWLARAFYNLTMKSGDIYVAGDAINCPKDRIVSLLQTK